MLRTTVMLMLAMTACNDGNPAGPDIDNVLDGLWIYSIESLEFSDGRVCGMSEVVLDLEQDGMHFSGTASGGTVTCSRPSGIEVSPAELFDGIVRNGRFDGDSVSFELSGDDIINHGVLGDGRIAGRVELQVDLPQPATSTFEAVRVES